ncbi:metallophosphoesterase family protein [Massilia yuzhufengensis]|uniref:3',5'-cyclic AMP phosphodiesterase CpdA n=1 Tax=Massilia yuzhufengensis TaxID=1164594 RepID=A0A1I1UR29_9BURK|nr:metallophosphoesterase [Massilia yuzhufengensis]SFD73292.1 3',5'-cyclic AMP phosphodiesterase CpdA [Massilia yuzhufengensis]
MSRLAPRLPGGLSFGLCLLLGAGPAAAGAYTVYAAGDIARCKHPDPRWSGAAATATLVEGLLRAEPDAAVLSLGDHTYPKGTAAEFRDCYGPTWGRFRDRTWPTPGNHEYATPGARPYYAYFGERAGRGYYALRLGSWLVVSLDSNLKGPAHAAQIGWLRAELARSPSRCTLAFWHHPLYTSGGHLGPGRMRDAFALLHAAGAEIVLSGHDHDYERFAPQDADGRLDRARGVRQFVVGTGGAYATPFLQLTPNSEVRDASLDGVLALRLLEGGYEWRFLPADPRRVPAGATPDHGRGVCH